jgi:hypothetical protein
VVRLAQDNALTSLGVCKRDKIKGRPALAHPAQANDREPEGFAQMVEQCLRIR